MYADKWLIYCRAEARKCWEGLAGGGDADNLLLESSAGADSGCGFSLSRPREGSQLPSERTANGGIILRKIYWILSVVF